jgi:UDP-N-acetylglucosamine transferase subunit ALG13
MIFVTVGAYDLPFDRLVKAVESLSEEGIFSEDVFLQIGHSVEPKGDLRHERFLSFDKMNEYADQASLIISQGGPGSIMLALARGKIPIVVPRQKQFGEMVDNHQVLFTQKLFEEKRILLVHDIHDLKKTVIHYKDKTKDMMISAQDVARKADLFAEKLEQLIVDILKPRHEKALN